MPRIWPLSYIIGAMGYFYMGTIALMYDKCHNVQGMLVFMIISSVSVVDMWQNPRSFRWLFKNIIVCILAPVYLFSGMSKL
eukprot:UN26040